VPTRALEENTQKAGKQNVEAEKIGSLGMQAEHKSQVGNKDKNGQQLVKALKGSTSNVVPKLCCCGQGQNAFQRDEESF